MPRRIMPSITWNANQTRRLKEAVRKYNSAITRMRRSNLYDETPNYVDYSSEYSMIKDRNQLYQRERELSRILLKNNPKANDVIVKMVGDEEVRIPRYLDTEIKYNRRNVNRRRSELRYDLYPNWDDMSPVERATKSANKNLQDIDPDGTYYTGADLDELIKEKYTTVQSYMDTYIEILEYEDGWSGARDEVIAIIKELQAKNPEHLLRLYELDYDEMQFYYIIESNQTDPTPFYRRRNNTVAFWRRQANIESISSEDNVPIYLQ